MPVSGVLHSEWVMPRPAIMRFSSPGRTTAAFPTESRWSIRPVNSHDTVASPVWGCLGTRILPLTATSPGP